MSKTTLLTVLAAGILSACGGGGGSTEFGHSLSVPVRDRLVPVTGTGATTNFSFDLGTVVGNRYFVTDRTNAAVDVFDTSTLAQVAQIKGAGALAFAGQGANNGVSGPDGINAVGNLLYVGDVSSVKIVDPSTNSVIKSIPIANGGVRADEGCVDPTHNLFFIASPEAAVPTLTIINTQSQAVVGTVTFTDPSNNPSAGLEACEYDPASDSVYINNDGTTANPNGEMDVLPGAALRAIATGATVNYTALAGLKAFGLGNCDPTGLALGPGTDVAVNCREGTAGAPLLLQILDRNTGAVLAKLNAGGGDQLAYAASENRYFNAASRWTATGLSSGGACTTASPCTPRLITIDAGTRTVIGMVASGNNAHSVAFDPVTARVFLPTSSDAAPAGCADCSNGTAGLLVFDTRL